MSVQHLPPWPAKVIPVGNDEMYYASLADEWRDAALARIADLQAGWAAESTADAARIAALEAELESTRAAWLKADHQIQPTIEDCENAWAKIERLEAENARMRADLEERLAPSTPQPAARWSERLIQAATHMDWGQSSLHRGSPCFHLELDGRFCGRAFEWAGHDCDKIHLYEPLYVAITRAVKDAPRTVSEADFERACESCVNAGNFKHVQWSNLPDDHKEKLRRQLSNFASAIGIKVTR